MFRVHWEQSDLSAIPRAVVATFFDIYEDVSVGLFPLAFGVLIKVLLLLQSPSLFSVPDRSFFISLMSVTRIIPSFSHYLIYSDCNVAPVV